ncbi:MAG TPA: DUF4331 family protein, partial [Mycobacterium sp.]|nr:DUF4331 family protein [Mycobacterium sp.]
MIGLVIPAISVAGVFLRGTEIMERPSIDWRILGSGIAFGVVVVVLGTSGVPFGQEIIFIISMAVVCYMLVLHNTRMGIALSRRRWHLPNSASSSPTTPGTCDIKESSMTIRRREQAPTNLTRRAVIKASFCTTLSALSLSALHADDLSHHWKEGSGPMSHHLDTPLAAQNGQLYIDDLYVFSGNDSTVFVMDVNSNITGVHVKPGFHHEARYEFKVHFDGVDYEALTYRVSFGEAGSDGRQVLRLHALTGREAREDTATGTLVLEGRTGETASAGGTRVWAGRIGDSFYIDLSLLSKVNGAIKNGTAVDLSAWRPEGAKNSFAGKTVETIVLEVSHQHPQLQPGARIGVWCATKLATDVGGWRQINRGGYPMMWPIFWPNDTDFSNPANTRHPSEDFKAVGKYIGDQVSAVVAASGTSSDPKGYGQTVAREL